MSDDDVRRIVFEIMLPRLPAGCSFERFSTAFSDFEFIPVSYRGQIVGAIMRHGSELHAAVRTQAQGHWFGRQAMAVIADTIARHGQATTRVMDDHAPGHRFAKRLGFKFERSDGGMTYYTKR